MIPENDRIWARYGMCLAPFKTISWAVVDWDSRRWLTAEGPSEPYYDDDGELICAPLVPLFDRLEPGIFKVTLSATGQLLDTSTDPTYDCTPFISYPIFTEEQVGQDAHCCLKLSQLKECDRLAPCVDVVTTDSQPDFADQFVFKYEMLENRLCDMWKEALLVRRLSICSHIIPFHSFVISDAEPRLVGYMCKYIPDGSISESQHPFKRIWLNQLIEAVDELNLEHGIIHQDIAPRNIVVDFETDTLYIIDFGLAAPAGSSELMPGRNDIDGVIYTLYELLTHDTSFRDGIGPDQNDARSITQMEHWALKIQLEEDLSIDAIRSMLMEWVESRRQRGDSDGGKLGNIWDFPRMENPFQVGSISEAPEEDNLITCNDEPLEIPLKDDVVGVDDEPIVKREPLVHWQRLPSKKPLL